MQNPSITNHTNITPVDQIQGRSGEFRAIVKSQAGLMTTAEDLGIKCKWESGSQWKKAIDVFRGFKKGALQTIQFKATGSDYWLTVFARVGNKIKVMDEELFLHMEVGDINQIWSNTNLYSQASYQANNAKTWADKAFVWNHNKFTSVPTI